MKTIKLTEIQLKKYVEYLKENDMNEAISTISTTSTGSTSSYGTSSNNSNRQGSVNLKKNTNPTDIKKYTDKGINVNILDENNKGA